MQRRPLPTPPKNNLQVKEYTGAVKRGLKGYYVMPSDNGWSVRKADASATSTKFKTKTAAVSYARKSVDSGADIVLQDEDGTVTLVEIKAV